MLLFSKSDKMKKLCNSEMIDCKPLYLSKLQGVYNESTWDFLMLGDICIR